MTTHGNRTKAPSKLILPAAMVVGLLMLVLGMRNAPEEQLSSSALIVVNGTEVHLEDLLHRAQNTVDWDQLDEETAEQLLESIILDEVVYQRGVELGLLRSDAIIRRRLIQEVREFSMSEARARDVSEEDLRAFYDANPEAFVREPRVQFSEIFLSYERGGDRHQMMDDLYQRLVAGEQWESVTVSGSEGPPVDFGDRWLSETDLADLFGDRYAQAAVTTEIGDFSEPVRTAFGHHIIRIDGHQGGQVLSFEEAEPAVTVQYRRQITRTALLDYLAAARQEAEITISPDAITRLMEVSYEIRAQ